jgi:hypothetical protein
VLRAHCLLLVFNMHFTDSMDRWNPDVTDGFAARREVMLFNNAGISRTTGEMPTSIENIAANAGAFINPLEQRAERHP